MDFKKKVILQDEYNLYLQYVRFVFLISNKFVSKREAEVIASLQLYLDNNKGYISSIMRDKTSKLLKISSQNITNLLKSMSLKGLIQKNSSGYFLPKVFIKRLGKELNIYYNAKVNKKVS